VKSLTAPNFPHHRIAANTGQRRKSEDVEIVTFRFFLGAAPQLSEGADILKEAPQTRLNTKFSRPIAIDPA
jgi:hypothetical protein